MLVRLLDMLVRLLDMLVRLLDMLVRLVLGSRSPRGSIIEEAFRVTKRLQSR